MKTPAKIENTVEIIMLSTTKISYGMLLTIILVSMMLHTSVWAKDSNEKAVDVSASVTENLIAIQQGVENTTMLYGKTKEGLAILRNKIKLFNDIAKKLGNKPLADQFKGAVRQATKNITKMDGALKKLGNSKIGKVSKQFTKGLGQTMVVAENVNFQLEYIAKVKDLLKNENINYGDKADILRTDGFKRITNMVPVVGDLI